MRQLAHSLFQRTLGKYSAAGPLDCSTPLSVGNRAITRAVGGAQRIRTQCPAALRIFFEIIPSHTIIAGFAVFRAMCAVARGGGGVEDSPVGGGMLPSKHESSTPTPDPPMRSTPLGV